MLLILQNFAFTRHSLFSLPRRILATRISVVSVLFTAGLLVYVALSAYLLSTWIAPSLDGRTDQHIGADSATYVIYADELRQRPAGVILAVFYSYSFPNTLLLPVLLAFAITNPFAMAMINYLIFIAAFILLRKTFEFSAFEFLLLMLLNATTSISLLTVNKEIFDVLAVSLFLFAREYRRRGILALAVLIAILNRFEVGAVMLAFMLAESKCNPWRKRRAATLVVLTIAITILLPIVLPVLASHTLNADSDANHSAITLWLNNLELHYLYAVALMPKLGALLFAELVDYRNWKAYGNGDYANTYIVLSNNIANAVVCVALAWKRRIDLSSTVFYFAVLGCVLNTVSMSKQPRYLFFAYTLICLQVALVQQNGRPSWWRVPPLLGKWRPSSSTAR